MTGALGRLPDCLPPIGHIGPGEHPRPGQIGLKERPSMRYDYIGFRHGFWISISRRASSACCFADGGNQFDVGNLTLFFLLEKLSGGYFT